jgi:hypothetical protein
MLSTQSIFPLLKSAKIQILVSCQNTDKGNLNHEHGIELSLFKVLKWFLNVHELSRITNSEPFLHLVMVMDPYR